MQQIRKFSKKISVLAPFPGEFINPEVVNLDLEPNSILALPEWPFFCNEIFAPIRGFYKVKISNDNHHEFIYELDDCEGISLRVFLQYELNCSDDNRAVEAGEIIGNVDKKKAFKERRVALISLVKENGVNEKWILEKVSGKKSFKEGDVIGIIANYSI